MSTERQTRMDRILALLGQTEEMTVNEIADVLNVSTMTIRRYLNDMEEEGLLKRRHGKAVLMNSHDKQQDPYILDKQIEKNAEVKQRIGIAAASLAKPEQMVFFDSGSTTPYIAKHMDPDMHVSVLCYTFQNALEFYNRPNTKLILSGGFYDRDSNVFYSNKSLEIIRDLRADMAFISAGGVDKDLGLTTYFYFEAEIKKTLMSFARKVVLVTDSSKFGHNSITCFGDLRDVDIVVTDPGIPDEYRALLENMGIELILA